MNLRSGKKVKMADKTEQKAGPSTTHITEGDSIETHGEHEEQGGPTPTHAEQGDTTHTPTPEPDILQQLFGMMQGLNSKMDHNNKKVEENNKRLEEKMDMNNEKLEELREDINKKFENNNKRLEEKMFNMNKKFEETTDENKEKIVGLEQRLDGIDQEMSTEINKRVIAAAKGIKSQVTGEVEHLMIDGFREVDARIKEQDRKIESNTKLLTESQTNTQYTTIQTHACSQTPFYFFGDNRTHPKIFITRLRQHMNTQHTEANLKQNIRNMLKGQAEIWYELVEDKFENINEFEQLILKQYWSEYTQQKVRLNLFNGKYNENLGISRENYILKKVYNVRYLEPKFNESEMVRYLARHFQDDVHNVIITQRIVTIDALIEYLRGIDDYRTGWRKTAPRDDRRDGQNNQNWKHDNNYYKNKNYNENQNRNSRNFNDGRNFNNDNQNRNFGNYNNGRNYNQDNQNRNSGNFNNGRNYNTDRDYNRNNNGQSRYYGNQNNQNAQNRDERKTQVQPDGKRDSRTYAQVTNTNLNREKGENVHSQADLNKIQTAAQINTRTHNSDFQ